MVHTTCNREEGRGRPTTEFYKNGKPQIYCRGFYDLMIDEPIEVCKNCPDFVDGEQCENDFGRMGGKEKIMKELMDVLKEFDGLKNKTIIDNIVIAWSKINSPLYKKIGCSISGGSDSDIVLDIVTKCDIHKKVRYFWYNTGLEYQATKEHLKYLENKYSINIERERAIMPIPLSCKELGQPFISKRASENISRLQKHNFKWEDEEYDVLVEKYPNCKCALKWWCNKYEANEDGIKSSFDIERNKLLKEFMVENPPNFKISAKCCDYAKKKLVKNLIKNHHLDLNIYGVRKAEGGQRATAYKSCFSSETKSGVAEYRPIFWYTDKDKEDYEKNQNIIHSDCYTKYGMKRTGCACCPCGHVNNGLEKELDVLKIHEPLLYKAVNNIFKESFEYTRKYYEFRGKKESEEKQIEGQTTVFDFFS